MRLLTHGLISGVLFVLLATTLGGCTGSGGLDPTGQSDGHDRSSTANIVEVRMRPQQEAQPPFTFIDTRAAAKALLIPQGPALPGYRTPSSFSWGELNRTGSQFDPALPHNLVSVDPPEPDAVLFNPNWDPGDGLNGAAYCIFDFTLLGFSSSGENQTIGLLLPAVQKIRGYVGLAEFARNRWAWFEVPEDGVLTLDSFAPFEAPDGRILIALVIIGHDQVKLSQLHIGQPETRGIGDTGLADPGLYSIIPSIITWPLLPDQVDLSPGCAPINDQGQTGSCTAFGNADSAYNYELKRTYGPLGWNFTSTFNRCGPRYVYNQTGVDLGGGCPTGGRSTNDVGNWLLTHGTSTEMNAPFGLNTVAGYNCSTGWSPAALLDASLLKPDSKTFIGTDLGGGNYHWTDADIDTAKHVLKTLRHVIVFRTYLDSQFQWLNYAGGQTWTYNGSSIGGHCMCIVGYDMSKNGGNGAFKVRNSWGTDFGDNGYCWISFDSFRSTTAGTYGFYYTEDCNAAVVSRFIPGGSSIFWPCGFWIHVLFTDKIHLEWDGVDGAVRYVIYRDNTDGAYGTAKAGETSFDDMTDDFDAHVYWLQAIDGQGLPSELSNPVVGWRLPPPG